MTSPAFTPSINLVAKSETSAPFRSPGVGVEFLTSLNHAIRTPLSGILGLSELMLENPTDLENREYLISIRSCAAALNDLLSATLDYASHVSGSIHLEEQDFPLSTAVEAGLRDARQRAEDHATSLEAELTSGLVSPTPWQSSSPWTRRNVRVCRSCRLSSIRLGQAEAVVHLLARAGYAEVHCLHRDLNRQLPHCFGQS